MARIPKFGECWYIEKACLPAISLKLKLYTLRVGMNAQEAQCALIAVKTAVIMTLFHR
jgi:hypothetical protein